MQFVYKRVRIEKDKIIRIERSIFGSGKILVQVGQEVSPAELIGKTITTGGYKKINLAITLSVHPKRVKAFLQKSLGQRIYKGEVLARKKGSLFVKEKIILASSDALVDSLDEQTGEVKLSLLPKTSEIPAAVYGVVEEVDPIKGKVVIKTKADLIFGICGSGRQREGMLQIFDERGGLLNKNQIPTGSFNHILVGGGLVYKEAIAKAISENVSGIIAGGINVSDFRGIGGGRLQFNGQRSSDIGTSIVITEGFGSLSIGEDIYNVLKGHEHKFALIDGNKGLVILPAFDEASLSTIKKTQLPKVEISLHSPISSKLESIELKLGQTARIIAPPYMAEQGKIIAIDKTQTELPSGLKSFLITLETPTRKIKVPPFNIEVI
ncbi:hypothetical protein HYW42_04000 [Candidatus Daviesbacteria bacterium]|nr:hypothetical protein [Candidatus Daviesbacteria bacterium]